MCLCVFVVSEGQRLASLWPNTLSVCGCRVKALLAALHKTLSLQPAAALNISVHDLTDRFTGCLFGSLTVRLQSVNACWHPAPVFVQLVPFLLNNCVLDILLCRVSLLKGERGLKDVKVLCCVMENKGNSSGSYTHASGQHQRKLKGTNITFIDP